MCRSKGLIYNFLTGSVFTGACLCLFYTLVFLVVYCPSARPLTGFFLGSYRGDVFDEIWLHQACAQGLFQGDFFSVDCLNFPTREPLLDSYLGYLHVYFTWLLPAFVPWPLWWNICVILAVVLSAYTLYWVVKRITGLSFIGIAAGFFFVISPGVYTDIHDGYLCHLWALPLFVAFVFLYEAFFRFEEKPNSWIWLSLWTVAATGVYWISALFLFSAGVLAALVSFKHINKKQWIRLSFSVLIAAILLAPSALEVLSFQPVLRDVIENKAVHKLQHELLIDRCMLHNVPFYSSDMTSVQSMQRPIRVPGAQALPFVFVLLCALLIVLEYKTQKCIFFFWLLTLFFYVFSLGPYADYYYGCLADQNGNLVELPFMWMLKAFPILIRWSFPQRLTASIMVCLSISLGLTVKYILDCKWLNLKGLPKKLKIITGTCLNILAAAAICQVFSVLSIVVYPNYQEPLEPGFAPGYTAFLAKNPKGVALDLPIGFVGNTRHNYVMHKQKTIYAPYKLLTGQLKDYLFFTYLWLWNDSVCKSVSVNTFVNQPFLGMTDGTNLLLYGIRSPEKQDSTLCPLATFQDLVLRKSSFSQEYAKVYNLGLRYIVLHRANCMWLDPMKGDLIYLGFKNKAREIFGKPVFEDYQNAVYLLKKPELLDSSILSRELDLEKEILNLQIK